MHTAAIAGLQAGTQVEYDDRGVPHIFANNVPDAYRALGYVVARDRLFQLELSSRAGGGTLTELVGERALPVDRNTRALGMPFSARERLDSMDRNGTTWALASAYVDGVNAFIASLPPRDYPVEYKLLGRVPRMMQVVDILHLLNRMGQTLASSGDEFTQMATRALVGAEAADALFPVHAPIVEPLQPNGASGARFAPTRLPPPSAPDAAAVTAMALWPLQRAGEYAMHAPQSRPDDAIGSNSWAVAASRSATGHALLAGDPHLELTLPSIWYEAHLVVADSIDVYGVTIPGAPGIVIGFTPAVAWTFTNTGADVMDFYVETVNDSLSPSQYRLDDAWQNVTMRVESYRDPSGRLLATDTLYRTHRGPLRKLGRQWISTRWTVLESRGVMEAFDAATKGRSVRTLLPAMGALYEAPAQNLLLADSGGAIAIQSTGLFPLRPGTGRGDVLRDGSHSASDWIGYWPLADYPQSMHPAQGFLASANQEPIDPNVQPRYLGANWERPWRAMRINALLRADSSVTADAMRQFQTDPGSARADVFVPAFLAAVRASSSKDALNERASRSVALLSEWDRRYTRDNRQAVLFEEVMRQLSRVLWDELQSDSSRTSLPSDMMTAVLLQDSLSAWWDLRATPEIEHRDATLRLALAMGLDTVIAARGEPGNDRWRWDNVRFANIDHLLGLPAYSRRGIPVQGGSATLWPSTGDGRHGPSWRMVVEMSSPRKAWATYPGGQSGNPASVRYDDRLASWAEGKLDTLRVPSAPHQLTDAQRRAFLTLTPANGGR